MNLILAQSRKFNSVVCDFWQNENGDVFMTINQLAQALEYASKKGVENLVANNEYLKDEEFSTLSKVSTGTHGKGGTQETRIFTEDGIYEVTMLSKQIKAKEFRAFVRKILKSLRKGELQIVQHQQKLPGSYKEALLALVEEVEKNEQLTTTNLVLEQKVNELQPKATYYDLILQNKSLIATNIIAKDYGMSAMALNKLLHELGVQYKQGGIWLLYAKYQDKGYTQTYLHAVDAEKSKPHTKWTQAGRIFIYELLKREGIVPMIERDFEEAE